MQARRVILMAFGENKAAVVREALEARSASRWGGRAVSGGAGDSKWRGQSASRGSGVGVEGAVSEQGGGQCPPGGWPLGPACRGGGWRHSHHGGQGSCPPAPGSRAHSPFPGGRLLPAAAPPRPKHCCIVRWASAWPPPPNTKLSVLARLPPPRWPPRTCSSTLTRKRCWITRRVRAWRGCSAPGCWGPSAGMRRTSRRRRAG